MIKTVQTSKHSLFERDGAGALPTIDNDTISSVVFTKNDLSPTTLSPNQWHTIDELFDIAKTAINEAHIYSIEYDNSPYGNPKIIDIDWAENTADDEVTFYINNISKK